MSSTPPLPDAFLQRLCRDPLGVGEVIRPGPHKTILRARGCGAQGQDLWVKIYHYARWGVRWQSFVGRRGAAHDLRVARRLRALGVPGPAPFLALVTRNAVGWPVRSVYVTEWLEASTVADYCRTMEHGASQTEPEALTALARRLGRFAAELHRRGVQPKDLNLGNILLARTGTERLMLIDYEDVRFVSHVEVHWRRKNLAQMVAGFRRLPAAALRALCEAYVDGDPDLGEIQSWVDDVGARARRTREDQAFRVFTGQLQHARTQPRLNPDPDEQPAHAFLLQALRRFVSREPGKLELPAGVDPALLGRWAKHHNLGGIMHAALRDDRVPPTLLGAWKQQHHDALIGNLRALRATLRLLEPLEVAGVPAAIVRGLLLAHTVYPDPGMRPMRDIDVLIRPGDAAACERALAKRGWTPSERLRYQLVYRIDGTIFEVHWSLLTPKRYRHAVSSDDWIGARRRITLPEGELPALSPEHEFIGLLLHAFLHHQSERWLPLVDLALLVRTWPVDWERVQQFARDTRLTRLFSLALSFTGAMLPLGNVPTAEWDQPAAARKFYPAYRAQLFCEDSLRYYWRRKQSAIYYAETWPLKMRQIIRLISKDELGRVVRQSLKCLRSTPVPRPEGRESLPLPQAQPQP